LAVTVAALLGFAPAPFPKEDRGQEDLRSIQGEWVCTRLTCGGEEQASGYLVLFRKDRLDYPSTGTHFIIKLHSTGQRQAIERTSELISTDNTWRGIYYFTGSQLTICYPCYPTHPRPTDFNPTKPDIVIEVLRRRSPAK
jgi:uncharacterized protein (TIGR03067 family)